MDRVNTNGNGTQALELLTRIAKALERIERNQFDHAKAELNARYPYGRPVDRFGRN